MLIQKVQCEVCENSFPYESLRTASNVAQAMPQGWFMFAEAPILENDAKHVCSLSCLLNWTRAKVAADLAVSAVQESEQAP